MRTRLALVLSLLAAPVLAEEYRLGDLVVTDPVVRTAGAMAPTSAGYMTITNTGDSDDTLLAIEAAVPRVMIHNTVMDGDVARMEHVMQLDIPAGATVSFAPGGLHVMFMGLSGAPLAPGDLLPATLVFANAGRLDVDFAAVPLDAGAGN